MPKVATKISVNNVSFNRSIAGQIFTYILGEIVSLALKPGETISETKLAEKFCVSRTPVREAIAKLALLGFVEVRPQRGTFVSRLNIKKILDARFICEALEIAVVCALAENASTELIETCADIIFQQEEAARNNNALHFQKLDDKFHSALAEFTGFEFISPLIETVKSHMDRVRYLSLVEFSGHYDKVISQHKTILAAIGNGFVEEAKAAMSDYMENIFTILEIAPLKHPKYFEEA